MSHRQKNELQIKKKGVIEKRNSIETIMEMRVKIENKRNGQEHR